jgi:hypothetical protein
MKYYIIYLNNYLLLIFIQVIIKYKLIFFEMIRDWGWGLGIGDWGLGIGPNPQSPIPNPQSPIPNPQYKNYIIIKLKIKTPKNLIKFF